MSGYDVPRSQMFRAAFAPAHPASAPSSTTSTRRANLHLDLNPNRARYTTASRPHRQRSFDDATAAATESSGAAAAASVPIAPQYCNGHHLRYENIYEQIHEEPIYRNQQPLHQHLPPAQLQQQQNQRPTVAANAGAYGRLGIIGHGIGRIERHLSSSCGNIDHYNLGGHYAVLGHSHLGTVGHIRLNAAGSQQATAAAQQPTQHSGPFGSGRASATTATAAATAVAGKDPTVKTLNLFSCLSRENSQSMTNIHRAAAAAAAAAAASTSSTASSPPTAAGDSAAVTASAARYATGAIPKIPRCARADVAAGDDAAAAAGDTGRPAAAPAAPARMSKTSLQWMLINKWLPMWIGQEPDYNILDFNFMFSRQCPAQAGVALSVPCADLHAPNTYTNATRHHSLVRFGGGSGGGGGGAREHASADGGAGGSMRMENEMARRAFVGHGATHGCNGMHGNGAAGGSLRPMRNGPGRGVWRDWDAHVGGGGGGSLARSSNNGGGGQSPYGYRDEAYYYPDQQQRNAMQRPPLPRAAVRGLNGSAVDPFRSWELNAEHNSFRPAQPPAIRRITDGTFPAKQLGATSATAAAADPLTRQRSAMERVVPIDVCAPLAQAEADEDDSPQQPLPNGRRYSDDTEDDQHASGEIDEANRGADADDASPVSVDAVVVIVDEPGVAETAAAAADAAAAQEVDADDDN